MAFIVAGIVFLCTLALCGLELWANAMSDAPSVQGEPIAPTFWAGTIIAALIAATHFAPHLDW